MGEHGVTQAQAFVMKNKDHPFFLYYCPHNIHVPRAPNGRFLHTSECGTRGDSIEELDATVGAFLDTLEQAGLTQKTLVVFSSDNGPIFNDGYADGSIGEANGHKPAGPYRGAKYRSAIPALRTDQLSIARVLSRTESSGFNSSLADARHLQVHDGHRALEAVPVQRHEVNLAAARPHGLFAARETVLEMCDHDIGAALINPLRQCLGVRLFVNKDQLSRLLVAERVKAEEGAAHHVAGVLVESARKHEANAAMAQPLQPAQSQRARVVVIGLNARDAAVHERAADQTAEIFFQSSQMCGYARSWPGGAIRAPRIPRASRMCESARPFIACSFMLNSSSLYPSCSAWSFAPERTSSRKLLSRAGRLCVQINASVSRYCGNFDLRMALMTCEMRQSGW